MGGLNPFENQPLIESSSVTLSPMDDATSSNVAQRTCGSVLCTTIGITLFIAVLQFSFVVPPGSIGFPFISSVEMLSSKTQKLEQNNMIPTKEGLAVKLDTAVLYRLDQSHAAELYREVGTDYVHTLLEPEAASAVRGLTSESEAKALYSSGRSTIQDSLKEELTAKLGPRGIIVEDVLLKDIELPEQLSKSIELKVQAEQEAARMEFVLAKEKQEAERKAIEAQGIADFQKIVSEGISPELLQWKGVEATEKFAGAPNTKIVIMGNSGGDLPVILSAASDSPSS